MNDEPQCRPNRKRQLAGVLLVSVLVSYPLSMAHTCYALGRGWIPGWARRPSYLFYQPAEFVLRFIPAGDGYSFAYHWDRWANEWIDRGERDAASD